MSIIDQQQSYRIQVRGQLSPHWMSHFAGFHLRVSVEPDSSPGLVLSGIFKDQASLLGTLQTLYNLGCTLVSVERLEAAPFQE